MRTGPTAQRDGWHYGVLRTFKVVAALGRSFASGSGIELVADTGVMRSAKNYAHQLAERLEAELVDTPQQSPDYSVFPPQVDGLPTDADAITVRAEIA